MDYARFDTERRRLVAWLAQGPVEPVTAAAQVARLRSLAAGVVGDADRAKALRYVDAVQVTVDESLGPRHEVLARADAIMRAAQRSEGDPAMRRALVRQAVEEIARLAESAGSGTERGAVLDLNESLLELIALLDRQLAADGRSAPADQSAVDRRPAPDQPGGAGPVR